MTALVRAELRKLTTTRLWLWMLVLGLAMTGATTSAAIGFAEPGPLGLETAAGQRTVFAQATATLVVAGILGIVAVTSEFTHQTATPTFLATPRRGRVVFAKLLTYAAAGLGYAAACTAVVVAVALPWLAAKDVDVVLSGTDVARTLGGVALEVAFYAVLGVGLGCLMRNQIAAIVGFVVYIFVLGPILSGVHATSEVAQYLPYQAGNALGRLTSSVDEAMLGQAAGGLVLLAWALAFAALGTRVAIRRDIT
jgi:ABC-2 type transport system permease protein